MARTMYWTPFEMRMPWQTATAAAPSGASVIKPVTGFDISGAHGVRIMFVVEGADNEASGEIDLFGVSASGFGGGSKPRVWTAQKYLTLASVTSSTANIANQPSLIGRDGTIRWCDTIGALTTSFLADAMSAAFGANVAIHSPADNTPASLEIGNPTGLEMLAFSLASMGNLTAWNIWASLLREA